MRLRPIGEGDWRDLRIIDAGDARGVAGLAAIAARVEAGILPAASPVVVGIHPLGGGYPDALIAAPIDRATAVAVFQGSATALADCLEILEDALELFRRDLATGRLN